MTRRITDTARESEENPLSFLVKAMAFGTSGSIERIEAEGQRELIASDQIPTEAPPDAVLLSLGFTLGPATGDDPQFRDAALPPGWTKAATDHAMWSEIRDDRGRVRAGVFYKAAPYDRKAFLRLRRRFDHSVYHDGTGAGTYAAVITDGGTVVETLGEYSTGDYDAGHRLEQACEAWLQGRYPDWRNELAYWD